MRHYEDLGGHAAVLGYLRGGRAVRTDVEPPDGALPWNGRPVSINGGDIYCDACRDVIWPDENYGDPWPNVLATQKLKHGGTWCAECFAGDAHKASREPEESSGGVSHP